MGETEKPSPASPEVLRVRRAQRVAQREHLLAQANAAAGAIAELDELIGGLSKPPETAFVKETSEGAGSRVEDGANK